MFADPQPDADETSFQVDNTSAAYYESVYYKLHKNDLQPVPAPRIPEPRIDLTDDPRRGRSWRRRRGEEDQLPRGRRHRSREGEHAPDSGASDRERGERRRRDGLGRPHGGATGPAFFFHLGDVVYNFGEGQYYYDQFYEPFRGYDRPIFAIPGNHDGMVFGDETDTPQMPTLTAFLRNFCAEAPAPVTRRRHARALHDDPARRLLHPRRPLRLDRRPLHQRARRPRRHLLARAAHYPTLAATTNSSS